MNAMDSATLATATLNLVDAESDYEVARLDLHAAQRAFSEIGAATLLPIDVAHAGLVQSALSALVAA